MKSFKTNIQSLVAASVFNFYTNGSAVCYGPSGVYFEARKKISPYIKGIIYNSCRVMTRDSKYVILFADIL
jgi:hypothetical protein